MSKLIDNNRFLELFFNYPNKEFAVRESARLLKIAPTTASNYLKVLARKGLLLKKQERNHLLFRANKESSLFRFKKKHYNIEKIMGQSHW